MERYLQKFTAGVRADVQELVRVNFESLDPKAMPELFDTVMILKFARKTLPSYVWRQCGRYRNGLISYKRLNTFLESYMNAKQKAEMALRRQWSVEKKQQALISYVEAPLFKKKEEEEAASPSSFINEVDTLSFVPV